MPPTSTGLMAPISRPLPKLVALSRPRTPIGYVSATSDGWTVVFEDLATPTPRRARKRVKALTARPDRKTKTEKMTAAAAMIGGRRKRSASQPMGRAPSTMNARRRRADEDDHAVADAEAVADVGGEHAERGALEVLDRR